MNKERKYYIDNLRWICILLLIPFHTAMAWNSWGEGNYIFLVKNNIISSFIIFIAPWYMSLLFVLAGISAKLALEKRTYKQFIKERLSKLLIPLVTGILTIVPLMTYYADRFNNQYQGSYIEHYKIFFTKITDLTGYDGGLTPAHLWFLLYLLLISLFCILITKLQEKIIPKIQFKNINIITIILLGLLLVVSNPILNFSGKSIGTFLILYLLGYYVFSDENVINKIVKYRYIFLIIMFSANILDIYMYIWSNNSNDIINTIMMYITTYFGILTLLGFSKNNLNQNNKMTKYFTSSSFLIYIFHFIWIIIFQFYLSNSIKDISSLFFITVILSFIMTIVTIEIIKKIPIIKTLFGIKRN